MSRDLNQARNLQNVYRGTLQLLCVVSRNGETGVG